MCLTTQHAGGAERDLEPAASRDPPPRLEPRALGRRDRLTVRHQLACRLSEPGGAAQGGAPVRAARRQPAAVSGRTRGARITPCPPRADVGRGPDEAAGSGEAPVKDEHVVELEVRLEAAPKDVFPYFVEQERYVRWQGIRAELDPRPGGVFRVWMDERTVAKGEYVVVEPPERVVFTWGWEGSIEVPPGSTTVQLTLRADGDETVLSLRH